MTDSIGIAEVDTHLQIIGAHLDADQGVPNSIEPYLVAQALILIHAAMETEVKNAIVQRCTDTGDTARDKFVSAAVVRRVRSLRFQDLVDLLSGFDNTLGEELDQRFPADGSGRTSLGNIASNRQATAHQGVLQATWSEILGWWAEARLVIDGFGDIIGNQAE